MTIEEAKEVAAVANALSYDQRDSASFMGLLQCMLQEKFPEFQWDRMPAGGGNFRISVMEIV